VQWATQIGTSRWDHAWGVASDARGGVYVVGETGGDLLQPKSPGALDAVLLRYQPTGHLEWGIQLHSGTSDTAWAVAVDDFRNAYIAGDTNGDLGAPAAGVQDVFVAMYDEQGAAHWVTQFGTPGTERPVAIAVADGSVAVVGWTDGDLAAPLVGEDDMFVYKLDSSGAILWAKQFGTPLYDRARGVAIDDEGNIYVGGSIGSVESSPYLKDGSAVLIKLDPDGNELWTREIFAGGELIHGVFVDQNNEVYVCGWTFGDLYGVNPDPLVEDMFVAKFDAAGALLWGHQRGTTSRERAWAITGDTTGVYITGATGRAFVGPAFGSADVYVMKYSLNGDLVWETQVGSASTEESRGIGVDAAGRVTVAGRTLGDFPNQNSGGLDIFTMQFGSCYADCDGNGSLDVFDFLCFQDAFILMAPFADCDSSLSLDVFDFLCFQDSFVGGCE